MRPLPRLLPICAGTLAALLCGAVAVTGPAVAQTMARPGQAAPAANPTAPAGAAQPGAPNAANTGASAPATPDDPAKVAAARAFVLAYHPQQDPAYAAKMLDKFMPRMIAQAKAQDPKLDAKKFEQERRALILANFSKNLDMQAHVVSRHFTLQELNGLTGFFRDGLGKRLVEETPKIQADVMAQRHQQMLTQPIPGMKPKGPAPAPAAPAKGAAPHK